VPARAWHATPDEGDAIARLLIGFRDHMGAERPGDASVRTSVARLLGDADTEFLLASPDDDSPPAGVLQLRFRFGIWKAAPDAWLEDLFVREAARRAGIGDALLRLAIERAIIRGARRIELDCHEENVPALALYERHGFSSHSKGNPGRDLLLGRVL
jgi:GNAT superfamily N-acetyltransferase